MARPKRIKFRPVRIKFNGDKNLENGDAKPAPLFKQLMDYAPWKTLHLGHLETVREAVHSGYKNLGRNKGEVLEFPEPPDILPPEQYAALMQAATKKLGLRTAYSSELPDLLLEHMSGGGTLDGFAGRPEVGVSQETLWQWFKRYPELRVAKEVGHAIAQRYWEGILGQSMFLPEGVKFNSNALRMVMQNRFGYREKISHEGPDGEALPALPPMQQPYRNLDILSVQELKDLRTILTKMETHAPVIPEPKTKVIN